MVRGPEFPSVPSESVISITYVNVRPERLVSFAQDAREVISAAALRARGKIFSTYRSEGNRFYTLTVWQDQASMETFRDSEPHKSAMGRVRLYATETRFANPSTMPRDWDEAKAIIEQAPPRPPRNP